MVSAALSLPTNGKSKGRPVGRPSSQDRLALVLLCVDGISPRALGIASDTGHEPLGRIAWRTRSGTTTPTAPLAFGAVDTTLELGARGPAAALAPIALILGHNRVVARAVADTSARSFGAPARTIR